jgi:hypothetical protein
MGQIERLSAGSPPDAYTTLVAQLVEDYCYDLRDFAPKLTASRPHLPQGVFAFQASPKLLVITEEMVKRLSFTYALSAIFGIVAGDERPQIGYAEIGSKPEEAIIQIDGSSKGYTNRSFVLSTGSHVVRIYHQEARLDCTRQLNIKTGERARAQCP